MPEDETKIVTGRRRGDCETGRRKIATAERRALAVEYRKLGLSFQKIGDQLGISRQAAFKLVKGALADLIAQTSQNAEELRRLELERLDEWQLKVEQELKNGKVLGSVDRLLGVLEHDPGEG